MLWRERVEYGSRLSLLMSMILIIFYCLRRHAACLTVIKVLLYTMKVCKYLLDVTGCAQAHKRVSDQQVVVLVVSSPVRRLRPVFIHYLFTMLKFDQYLYSLNYKDKKCFDQENRL